jgi:hypothetical protein
MPRQSRCLCMTHGSEPAPSPFHLLRRNACTHVGAPDTAQVSCGRRGNETALAMSGFIRIGSHFACTVARSAARGSGRSSGGGGGAAKGGASSKTGAARHGGTGRPGRTSREFRALPRTALRARSGPRAALRNPRATSSVMFDLFLNAWDDFEDR